MLIVCEKCQAKFRVNQNKVKTKSFRFRCRKCSHSMIVRSENVSSPYQGEVKRSIQSNIASASSHGKVSQLSTTKHSSRPLSSLPSQGETQFSSSSQQTNILVNSREKILQDSSVSPTLQNSKNSSPNQLANDLALDAKFCSESSDMLRSYVKNSQISGSSGELLTEEKLSVGYGIRQRQAEFDSYEDIALPGTNPIVKYSILVVCFLGLVFSVYLYQNGNSANEPLQSSKKANLAITPSKQEKTTNETLVEKEASTTGLSEEQKRLKQSLLTGEVMHQSSEPKHGKSKNPGISGVLDSKKGLGTSKDSWVNQKLDTTHAKRKIRRRKALRRKSRLRTKPVKVALAELSVANSSDKDSVLQSAFARMQERQNKITNLPRLPNGKVDQAKLLRMKLRREIRRWKTQIRTCYTKSLKRQVYKARLLVELAIKQNGSVSQVNLLTKKYSKLKVTQCIMRSMKKWRFAIRFKGADVLRIQIPYNLTTSGM